MAITMAVFMFRYSIGHANLIVNGGFEDGVYSSASSDAIPGVTVINPNIPTGWTPSPGFDISAWNGVQSYNPYTGHFGIEIGNDPGYPLASISQNFYTISGQKYAV